MQKTQHFIQAQRERFMSELFDLLRIPSISADPAFAKDVHACAAFVADRPKELEPMPLRFALQRDIRLCTEKKNHGIHPCPPPYWSYGHYDAYGSVGTVDHSLSTRNRNERICTFWFSRRQRPVLHAP